MSRRAPTSAASHSYRRTAGVYDKVFAGLNRGLVSVVVKRYPAAENRRVLDVGCGPGHLAAAYLAAGSSVTAIDCSPAMLRRAKARLRDEAVLQLGDATEMPYANGSFDLAIAMMLFHELEPQQRSRALAEMLRVVAPKGRVLIVDHHSGDLSLPRGWLRRSLVIGAEAAAGPRHFARFVRFLSRGGIPAHATSQGLPPPQVELLSGGGIGLFEITPERPDPSRPS